MVGECFKSVVGEISSGVKCEIVEEARGRTELCRNLHVGTYMGKRSKVPGSSPERIPGAQTP